VTNANAVDLGILLGLASAAHADLVQQHLAAAGFEDVRRSDTGILFLLQTVDDPTVGACGKGLGVTKQAAAQTLHALADRGYVTLDPSPTDGRQRVVRLTERGQAQLRAAFAFSRELQAELVQELGEAQVASARSFLRAVVQRGVRDGRSPIVRRAAALLLDDAES
jgi:DNA-binding MarR family transcriptional regulator